MAEGFVESFLGGGEAEEPDGGALAAGLSDAVALDLAGGSEEARAYLKDARRLVAIQTEHLHEQRAIQLSHLKLRRFMDRLRAANQVFFILAATVLGLGALSLLYDAFSSHSVVVNAFKTPPALASRGVTGEVVASGVLDTLRKLQDATRSDVKGLDTRSAWASDIKIEAPGTGISIGELDRLLHERFGHDVHIDGDLIQTETGGLTLTVRGDGIPAGVFSGTAGDLDKLTAQAAEYVYGRAQPTLYVTYLGNAGRWNDSLAFLPGAFARAHGNEERAKLANLWGGSLLFLGQQGPAVDKLRLARSLSPPRSKAWWKAQMNLIAAVETADGEETGWREGREYLRVANAAPRREKPPLAASANAAGSTWDLPLLLASLLSDLSSNGVGTMIEIAAPGVADTYALMHDPGRAAHYMAISDPNDPATKVEALMLKGYAALDRQDPVGAITPLEALDKIWLSTPVLQNNNPSLPCYLGLAYGLAGRTVDAAAVFRRIKTPWSICYAFEGDGLAHTGDVAGAERVWAEGVRLLPDLPNVYLHRGLWEMAQGDNRAAAADLAAARAKAPHFADTRKAWADLLAREGQWSAALNEYDEALKYAPAWAELRAARARAARALGRP